jgi:sterol desaturase/sphingolipid hydroxylase (fatty acid hydroxylase superfamily)
MIFAPQQDKLSAMPVWKFLLRFLAIYLATFVLVYLIPDYIHRRDFDWAFFAWFHDRTPQNEAVLRSEQHKNEMIKLVDTAVIALVFVTLGLESIMFVASSCTK